MLDILAQAVAAPIVIPGAIKALMVMLNILAGGWMLKEGIGTFMELPREKAERELTERQRHEDLMMKAMLTESEAKQEASATVERRTARADQSELYREGLRNQSQMALTAALASMLGGPSAEQQMYSALPNMQSMAGGARQAARSDIDRILAQAPAAGGWESLFD